MNATQMPLFDAPTALPSQYGHSLPMLAYAGEPPSVGRDTSKAGAEAVKPRVANLQGRVLLALYNQPGLSDEGLERVLDCAATRSSRPRRRELELAGFIRDSGERVLGSAGVQTICWVLTSRGEAKARSLLADG